MGILPSELSGYPSRVRIRPVTDGARGPTPGAWTLYRAHVEKRIDRSLRDGRTEVTTKHFVAVPVSATLSLCLATADAVSETHQVSLTTGGSDAFRIDAFAVPDAAHHVEIMF